ncbi:MAG: HAD family hydrolase [Actinomycetota bacterium]
MIRAVLFDAGETLLSAHPSFPELLATTLRTEGHDHVTPGLIHDQVRLVGPLFEEATKQGRLWSTSAEESLAFWSELYRVLLGALGVPFTEELARTLYGTFTDVANYRLFDDALPVLAKLRDAGLRLGLISNFEQWLERLLEHLEVTDFFEVRVISGVEGMEKPDPKIFRLALDRMGVAPEHAAYVGDNVTYDVEPAAALGMTGVLLDRRGRNEDFQGLRIASLDELPGVLGL